MVFLKIAGGSFKEILRQPIYIIILFTTQALIVTLPLTSLFSFGEQLKLITDSALALILLFGWITAVLVASFTISREISNGTTLLLFSKPVNRPSFIIGKILSILGVLAIFVFLNLFPLLFSLEAAISQYKIAKTPLSLSIATLIISATFGGIRNFSQQKPFSLSTIYCMLVLFPTLTTTYAFIGKGFGAEVIQPALLTAFLLLLFAIWMMGTIATTLSTICSTTLNMLICFCVFIMGLLSNYLFGRLSQSNTIYHILYTIVPNWQNLWLADPVNAGKPIPLDYILWSASYSFSFILLLTMIAIGCFQFRELGQQKTIL